MKSHLSHVPVPCGAGLTVGHKEPLPLRWGVSAGPFAKQERDYAPNIFLLDH